MRTLEEKLRDILRSEGASLVGFGDLRRAAPGDLPAGVSVAVRIEPQVVRTLSDGPVRAYYDAYFELNRRLDRIVSVGAEFLEGRGFRARAQTTAAVTESGDYRTALPHKTVATRAGLGWIGKCALLVTREYGSAVRLSSLLTDAPLPPVEPVDESNCGVCTACREVCPGRAVSGKLWRLGMDRDEFFDPLACRAAARALAKGKLNEEITLCGRCIGACPYTKRYLKREAEQNT